MKDRQYNGQKIPKGKWDALNWRTNNDLQNITQNTKEWTTRISLKQRKIVFPISWFLLCSFMHFNLSYESDVCWISLGERENGHITYVWHCPLLLAINYPLSSMCTIVVVKIPKGKWDALNWRTNNDLQNITQNTKDWTTRISLKQRWTQVPRENK
jgi:hypothetical protein